MSSTADRRLSRQAFWPSVLRIFVIQAVVLLALAGAVVGYISWSSDMAYAEFLAAGKAQAAPNSSLQAIKVHLPCDVRA